MLKKIVLICFVLTYCLFSSFALAEQAKTAPQAKAPVQAQPTKSLPMPSKTTSKEPATPATKATPATPATPATKATPATPATKATPATPATKATPATPAKKTTPKKKKTTGKNSAEQGADVGVNLDKFAQDLVIKMNANSLSSESKKKVAKNADGTYSATYKAVDHKTVRTSYSKPDNAKSIAYIGHIAYEEVSYTCTGKTAKDAKSADCKEQQRAPIQELVKHKNGRWTY